MQSFHFFISVIIPVSTGYSSSEGIFGPVNEGTVVSPRTKRSPPSDQLPFPGQCGLATVPIDLTNSNTIAVQAPRYSLPWVVSLRIKGKNQYLCTGMIIRSMEKDRSNLALISAQCIIMYKDSIDEIIVIAGINDNRVYGEIAHIKNYEIILVKNSDTDGLGLLLLDHSFKFDDHIQPICLPSPDLADYNGWRKLPAITTGWAGVTDLSTPYLHYAKLRSVVSKKNPDYFVEYAMFYAVTDIKSGRSCRADPGGPYLTAENGNGPWTVRGIFIKKCAYNYAGVYVNVTHFLDWMKDASSRLLTQNIDRNSVKDQKRVPGYPPQPIQGQCGITKIAIDLSKGLRGPVAVDRRSFPWIVSIRIKKTKQHICGGILLRSSRKEETNVVLATAQCAIQIKINEIEIVAGAAGFLQWKSKSDISDVAATLISVSLDDGIALLRLSTPIKFRDDIQPICLPFGSIHKNWHDFPAAMAGWENKGKGNFQQMRLRPISDETICRKWSKGEYGNSSAFCGSSLDRIAPVQCLGEAGSPYLALEKGTENWAIYGIAIGSCKGKGSPVFISIIQHMKQISDFLLHPEQAMG